MSSVDDLLNSIETDATPQELGPVAHYLGGLVVRGDDATLERFYDRMRQMLRRGAYRDTLHGFLHGQVQLLEGYFASREPIRRLELLAKEVESNPFWLAIMRALDGSEPIDLESLHARIVEAASPGAAPFKSELMIAIQDLAMTGREIVERFPSDGGVTLCALTRLGRALLFKITQHDPAAAAKKA